MSTLWPTRCCSRTENLGGAHTCSTRGAGLKTNTRLTSIQFYAYRLMLRDYAPEEGEEAPFWEFNQASLPHSGGLLFQQWICDAYSRAEAQRLAWVVMHQDQLRA